MELVERDPKVLKGLHNSNELRITQEIRKNFKRSNQQFSFMNVLFYGILIPIYMPKGGWQVYELAYGTLK